MSRPSDIRTYIKNRVREVIPRAVESENPHTAETVGSMKYDETYFVDFQPLSFTGAQGFSQISFPILIEIGKKGGTSPIAAHDDILNDALDIAKRIEDRSNFADDYADIAISTVDPQNVEGNERWTVVSIEASFIIHC